MRVSRSSIGSLSLAVMALLVAPYLANAQTFVIPNTVAESATSSGVNTIIRSAPRTYQAYYAANQFTGITQQVMITGMQLRLAIGENWRPAGYVGATWPDVAINFTTWDVTMAIPTAQLVTDGEYLSTVPTFASYMGGNTTLVRSGALAIAAGDYLADGGAAGIHSFGPVINFTTPYLYTPGDGLILQVNHQGYAPSTVLNAFFATTGFVNGSFDAISSTASGTAAAPSGFSSPYYIQFTFTPVSVPEPTTMALIGLVGIGAVAGRRYMGRAASPKWLNRD